MNATRSLLFALCGLTTVSAQDFFSNLLDPLAPFPPKGQPQPGLLPQNGPWNNDVLVYHAKADGGMEKLATFPRAGVPTITRMQDGRLIAAHQHFPENDPASFDKVAIHFSSDEVLTHGLQCGALWVNESYLPPGNACIRCVRHFVIWR